MTPCAWRRPLGGAGLWLAALTLGAAGQGAAPDDPARADEKARREETLRAVEEALSGSAEARQRLEREVAAIRGDRAALNERLIATTRAVQEAEERVRAVEGRLRTLGDSEAALRRSLEARRGVLGEVLAALQRMGRRAPPALLARPEDVLEAVRTAVLLGAVLPELRAEAEALAADLAEIARLKDRIAAERDALRRDVATLGAEQNRLSVLIAARQRRVAEAERGIAGEEERAAGLAAQARSLKELIDRMEREVSASRRAAEEAQRATDAQARETRERFAAAAIRDPARLAPKIPFGEARGLLARPVSGETLRGFGEPDGSGGTTRGIAMATRPRAVVASPADGWVAFAGPFRSFGRLLIINAGGGYYLLLAGMDRISVEVGQFVLAGEPVGAMGETASPSPAGPVETKDPVLFIELRKDGGSIDPSPWWAKSQGEKVRG